LGRSRRLIKFRDEKIIARMRSVVIDGLEVDMLIESDKSIYVIEVEIKPTIDIQGIC